MTSSSRAFSIASRAIRPAPRVPAMRTPRQRRFASSDQDPQRMSIAQFYKTFTRPVAKVLLIAFFTYQVAYWGWTKLEHDEIMAEREDYIAELEDEVTWLTGTPVGSSAVRAKEAAAAVQDHPIEFYQRQLMELESKNKELLTAIAQAQGAVNGEESRGEEKKAEAMPWWKVW